MCELNDSIAIASLQPFSWFWHLKLMLLRAFLINLCGAFNFTGFDGHLNGHCSIYYIKLYFTRFCSPLLYTVFAKYIFTIFTLLRIYYEFLANWTNKIVIHLFSENETSYQRFWWFFSWLHNKFIINREELYVEYKNYK